MLKAFQVGFRVKTCFVLETDPGRKYISVASLARFWNDKERMDLA